MSERGVVTRTLSLAATALAAAFAFGAQVGEHAAQPETVTVAQVAHTERSVPAWMTRPCASEDSVNCYWDAKARGNGEGLSYYVREMPGRKHMVCVLYVKRPRLDYCA